MNLSHMNLDHNKITNPRNHWTRTLIEASKLIVINKNDEQNNCSVDCYLSCVRFCITFKNNLEVLQNYNKANVVELFGHVVNLLTTIVVFFYYNRDKIASSLILKLVQYSFDRVFLY